MYLPTCKIITTISDQFSKLSFSCISCRKFKILELLNVERKLDKQLGSRFLLEFLVKVSGKDKPAMISEFVFLPKDSENLCYPKGL